ncbi:hypothetical protein HU200_047833 [Digitaria exilis]|uniref:Dirigent protein n=1 Tax=Digitaria exilis TaxID=1010633 RepID=A0A835AWR9_9POAL|nr:hypothetical protein HU200_047833 [Digitaria exilis]CAB3493296.1 unnamed protein product [Digitaria exilis]
MLARIIFCVFVAAAVLAVVLLATISPLPHRAGKGAPGTRTFTVYVHPTVQARQQGQLEAAVHQRGEASALVFHHRMTAAPERTSRTIGVASGFVLLPAGGERGVAVTSVFDTVHLAFDGGGAAGMFAGSLCVEAEAGKRRPGKRGRDAEEDKGVLRVVGGTGAFAFARGHAIVRGQRAGPGDTAPALLLEISVSSAGSLV